MTTDWLEMMRAHTKDASDVQYEAAWMALAMHLAEAHPAEAAAWIERQSKAVA